ncbi:MAG: hypothetical protein AAF151_26250 [Cyanobacteria bacterium J06656_5]
MPALGPHGAIEEIDLDFLAADIPPMLASMTQGTQRIREIVKSLRVFSRLDEAELKSGINLKRDKKHVLRM